MENHKDIIPPEKLIVEETPEYVTTVKHSVNPGDLIAAMGAVKKYYDVTKRKVIVAQSTNTLAAYYAGAVHPTLNELGQQICCNNQMWEMLKPLIESQEYIHAFEKYDGQKIDLNFDVIRGKTFVNLPHGALQSWIVYAFPDLSFDISKPWITLNGECPEKIKEQVSGKVILNFTERYRNNIIDYFFLKNYAPDLIFAGTEREHWLFCNQWQLNVPRLEIDDFLQLAYALKEARFLLSNQSFQWNLAEAIKIPRILEVCQFAQNCQPFVGEDSVGFFHQVGVEYYFRKFYNTTK
ncbi:MAG TPA: hypothetical protein VIY47_14940 [Ignavibacteriaceae bacterium]